MSTGRNVPLDRQIVEIERTSSRRAPNLGDQTPELARGPRRHDPTIALLLVLSIVFLVVGVATGSIGAWLPGVISLLAALSIDARHERELRDHRRSRELDVLRRRQTNSRSSNAVPSARLR